MAHDVRIIPAAEFLQITIDGAIDIDSSEQILRQIAASCREHNQHHVLIDGSRIPEGSLSVIDVYQLGSGLQAFGFGPSHRIAILYHPGREERAKFLELVATNRGASLRVFENIENARAWLSEEP